MIGERTSTIRSASFILKPQTSDRASVAATVTYFPAGAAGRHPWILLPGRARRHEVVCTSCHFGQGFLDIATCVVTHRSRCNVGLRWWRRGMYKWL